MVPASIFVAVLVLTESLFECLRHTLLEFIDVVEVSEFGGRHFHHGLEYDSKSTMVRESAF